MKKKLRELLQNKAELVEQAKNAIENDNIDLSNELIAKAELVQNKIDTLNKIETFDSKEDFKTVEDKIETGIHAIVNYMRTGIVNEAGPLKESSNENGGYLVPVDIKTAINEYKRSFVSLKDLVRVEKVNVPEGERTYEKTANLTPLANITELGEIPEVPGSMFERIKYSVSDFGGILPVSNSLLKDSPENIMAYLSKWFGKKSIVTENKEISKILLGLEKTEITTVDDIKTAINVTLDPLFVPATKIVTNQSGFDVLDKLKDKNNNYLLQPHATDRTMKQLFGFDVIVISDSYLSNEDKTKFPLFIGSLEEAITFYELESLEILSTNIGGKALARNSYDTRMIERFDVKPIDKAAVVHLDFTKALKVALPEA